MTKYRKKPIVVEAEHWFGQPIEGCKVISDYALAIPTLEGEMIAQRGDWIITGVKGEKYPCKPDIFDMTYELVEEL